MNKFVVQRIVAVGVVLTSVVVALGWWHWKARPLPAPPIELVIRHTLAPRDTETLQRVVAPFVHAHPDVHITFRHSNEEPRPTEPHEVALRTLREGEPGIPVFAGNYVVLAYRRTVVTTAPSSWSEIRNTARQLQESGTVSYGLAIPEEPYAVLPLLSDSLEHGGDGNAGLALLSDLRFETGVTPSGCLTECVVGLLANRRAAFGIVGEWRLPELRKALGDELAIVALPDLPNGQPVRSSRTIYGLVSSDRATTEVRSAIDTLAHYLRVEARDAVFQALGKVSWPPSKKAASSNPSMAEAAALVDQRATTMSDAQLQSALAIIRPLWAELSSGTVSVEAAADKLLGEVGGQARR